jgi:hypothetical protein
MNTPTFNDVPDAVPRSPMAAAPSVEAPYSASEEPAATAPGRKLPWPP